MWGDSRHFPDQVKLCTISMSIDFTRLHISRCFSPVCCEAWHQKGLPKGYSTAPWLHIWMNLCLRCLVSSPPICFYTEATVLQPWLPWPGQLNVTRGPLGHPTELKFPPANMAPPWTNNNSWILFVVFHPHYDYLDPTFEFSFCKKFSFWEYLL